MTRLFGTDGIRGRALEPPLDEDTVKRLGCALAEELTGPGASPHILLAGDTRASTTVLAEWFAAAFQAAGGRITWGGVLPTPAVSHIVRGNDFTAGVVVSASHNPSADNGIKILGGGGEKLDDETEQALEARLSAVRPDDGPGLPPRDATLENEYLALLRGTHRTHEPLRSLKVVVDAANGAASRIAGSFLAGLGAKVDRVACEPDGTNINDGCGATAPGTVAKAVLEHSADCGLALDGDADRVVLVDEQGEVLDGDDLLLIWARHLAAAGSLPGGRVVATVMSNFGLERALEDLGLAMTRCPVGDRSVWLAMQEHGAALGGEQSGHIICSHYSVSGDGLLTGSQVLAILASQAAPLSELSRLERMPQTLLNVPVSRKLPFEHLPRVCRELSGTERRLDGRGRVLLRYSGTEPVARVMIEGEDALEIETLASQLADTIRTELQ
jgi:phosphoglucosamine mutase